MADMMEASRPLAEALVERTPFDHTVTLRDHVDADLILREFIAEHEGEITPEIEALLLDHENATKDKITKIGWYVKTQAALIESEKDLIRNLAARVTARANRVEWLKASYLFDQMQRLGLVNGDKIDGVGVTARFQLNNPKLVGEVAEDRLVDLMIDPDKSQFVRYVPEQYQLNKKAALDALKAANKLVADVNAASVTIGNAMAKQKDKDAAERFLVSVTDTEIADAIGLIADFPELSVVRDLSVRIA